MDPHTKPQQTMKRCDPGPSVTKDPSKTFYFHDVLIFILREHKWIHLYA